MGEWRRVTLGEVAAEVTVGHVGAMAKEYREHGIPFLRSQNVLAHRVDLDDIKFIDAGFHARLKKSALRPGDVVTVRTGKPGTSAVIPDWIEVGNCADLVITRPGPELDSRWLSYYLNCVSDIDIAQHLVGAVQQHFNVGSARALILHMPELAEQKMISQLLGALDDKIAANRKVGGLIDRILAESFDRLAVGVEQAPLRTIADVNRQVVKPSLTGTLRYLDIASVAVGAYEFPPLSAWASAPGRARRKLVAGDTVWSTVRPNRRSHALVLDEDPMLIASTGLAVLTPHDGRVTGVYESSRRTEFTQYLESVAEGSAYPAVNASRFYDAPVPALSSDAWNYFESFALPLRHRAHAAAVENRRLEATRDDLLPLLVTGRVTVGAAESLVEAVV